MDVSKTYYRGNVTISLNAIATIAGNAACECYGVVGLANKSGFRESIEDVLDTRDYVQGVELVQKSSGIEISLYLIVAYGVKITEIANEVQKKVQYVLAKDFNLGFVKVNVYVKSIKNIK